MNDGYIGKILEVNLNNGKLTDKSIAENITRKYLGGKGLGLKLLYDKFNPDIDHFFRV